MLKPSSEFIFAKTGLLTTMLFFPGYCGGLDGCYQLGMRKGVSALLWWGTSAETGLLTYHVFFQILCRAKWLLPAMKGVSTPVVQRRCWPHVNHV
jgi:hypothetical protein